MSIFAKGARALARCPRCGDKVAYLDLVPDGQVKGQMVCPSCQDMKHPTELPFRTDEGIALRRPAPDTDDDSVGDSGTSVADALFPGGTVFGGGT